ncbi:hypothetical protein B0T16DRAFT_460269 [Cercophora newfieldiana]|uniref:Uncharacterized protein n=1 Tax=Cercophora newfieldiana TaxID=92897 RepID=A0AA39Y1H5_9PEZI|nr:hypothetical protein B0T16DRAFT_460269 [Cercophora newfieldiana]
MATTSQNQLEQPPLDYGDGTWVDEFQDFSLRNPNTGRAIHFRHLDIPDYTILFGKLWSVFCVLDAELDVRSFRLFCHPGIPEGPRPFAIGGFVALWEKHPDPPMDGRRRRRQCLLHVADEHIENAPVSNHFPSDEEVRQVISQFPGTNQFVWDAYGPNVIYHCPTPPRQTVEGTAEHTSSTTTVNNTAEASGSSSGTTLNSTTPPSEPERRQNSMPEWRCLAPSKKVSAGSTIAFRHLVDGKAHGSLLASVATIIVRKGDERYLLSPQQIPNFLAGWHGRKDLRLRRVKPQLRSGKPAVEVGTLMGLQAGACAFRLDKDVVSDNLLPVTDAVPKRLLPTSEVNPHDEFFLVSKRIEPKRVRVVGKRWYTFLAKAGDGAREERFVGFFGRCVSGDPCMLDPDFQKCAIGAVLLRCRDSRNAALTQKDVLDRGEVWGMLLENSHTKHYMEVLTFDSLIEKNSELEFYYTNEA